MEQKVEEIYNDALEALQMSDGMLTFDEWAPAFMLDENGDYVNDGEKASSLLVIWNRAKTALGLLN